MKKASCVYVLHRYMIFQIVFIKTFHYYKGIRPLIGCTILLLLICICTYPPVFINHRDDRIAEAKRSMVTFVEIADNGTLLQIWDERKTESEEY